MNALHKVLIAMAAALATAAGQSPNNITITTGTPQLCSTGPDAQMTVGKTPQGFYFDSRDSNGTTYSQTSPTCNTAYTVDINLPGSYTAPGIGNRIVIGGGFQHSSQLTEANCKDASVSLLIHKRTHSVFGFVSDWKLVSAQSKQGVWVPFVDIGIAPYCALASPFLVTAPAGFSYDQYRVMVTPKLSGAPVAATVGWEWTY